MENQIFFSLGPIFLIKFLCQTPCERKAKSREELSKANIRSIATSLILNLVIIIISLPRQLLQTLKRGRGMYGGSKLVSYREGEPEESWEEARTHRTKGPITNKTLSPFICLSFLKCGCQHARSEHRWSKLIPYLDPPFIQITSLWESGLVEGIKGCP